LDEAGSLYVSRTTTRLVEEVEEEDLQHHVLAIFRSCASIAVRQRIQKEATAKSSAVLYLFLSFLDLGLLARETLHNISSQGFPDQFEMETRSPSQHGSAVVPEFETIEYRPTLLIKL